MHGGVENSLPVARVAGGLGVGGSDPAARGLGLEIDVKQAALGVRRLEDVSVAARTHTARSESPPTWH